MLIQQSSRPSPISFGSGFSFFKPEPEEVEEKPSRLITPIPKDLWEKRTHNAQDGYIPIHIPPTAPPKTSNNTSNEKAVLPEKSILLEPELRSVSDEELFGLDKEYGPLPKNIEELEEMVEPTIRMQRTESTRPLPRKRKPDAQKTSKPRQKGF